MAPASAPLEKKKIREKKREDKKKIRPSWGATTAPLPAALLRTKIVDRVRFAQIVRTKQKLVSLANFEILFSWELIICNLHTKFVPSPAT